MKVLGDEDRLRWKVQLKEMADRIYWRKGQLESRHQSDRDVPLQKCEPTAVWTNQVTHGSNHQRAAKLDSQSSASLVLGRRDSTVLFPSEIIVAGRFDCSVTSRTARSSSASGGLASSVALLGAVTSRLPHAVACPSSS